MQSYEVNMSYAEEGQSKQALVKVNLCLDCAVKLNYRKLKDRIKKRKKKEKKRKRERSGSSSD